MYNLRVDERGNNLAKRQSKRLDENGDVRCVLLRDSVYLVPAAVYAGHGDGFDVRAQLDGLHFVAASNVHGDFDIHFARRSRVAGVGWRARFGKARKSGGRLLFRVARSVSVAKFCEGCDSEREAIFCGEFAGRGADNLRGRLNLDDSFA